MLVKERIAFEAMLAALIQCTSRADEDMKKYFNGRTSECERDYAQCIEAIELAKATLIKGDRG